MPRQDIDALTAGRADGVVIDHVDAPGGAGFKIDNPNAPVLPSVEDITVGDLKKLIDSGADFELLDVRTPDERARASIQDSALLNSLETERLEALPRDIQLVFYCHHGGRSRAAAGRFASLGFTRVHSVAGGIDAWAREIDSEVPLY